MAYNTGGRRPVPPRSIDLIGAGAEAILTLRAILLMRPLLFGGARRSSAARVMAVGVPGIATIVVIQGRAIAAEMTAACRLLPGAGTIVTARARGMTAALVIARVAGVMRRATMPKARVAVVEPIVIAAAEVRGDELFASLLSVAARVLVDLCDV